MSTSSLPTKVPIYSPTELKTTTDDALTPYLTALPQPYTFTPSNINSTIRLTLGYTAVLIAGLLFYADYRLGWDATKPYTLPACIVYFILNGALTGYIFFIERGTVFVGTRAGGQRLEIRSRGKKHSPSYALSVKYQAPNGGTVWEEKTFSGEFMQWFSKEGYLRRKEFAQWLSENVEVLGLAEKGRRSLEGKEEKVRVSASDTYVMDAMAGEDIIEVEPETGKTPGGGGKKGKGRKKAAA